MLSPVQAVSNLIPRLLHFPLRDKSMSREFCSYVVSVYAVSAAGNGAIVSVSVTTLPSTTIQPLPVASSNTSTVLGLALGIGLGLIFLLLLVCVPLLNRDESVNECTSGCRRCFSCADGVVSRLMEFHTFRLRRMSGRCRAHV